MFCASGPFWEVPSAPSLIFKFCAPGLIFDGTEGVGSHFNVVSFRPHFGLYRGRQVQFSCFALPDPFWAVPRASGLILMFCAVGPIFGGTEDLGSHFLILRSRTRFGRYRGRRVQFSCFALPGHFWAVPGVSGPVCHVLRSRTRFRWYGGPRVSFSCFSLLDSFWAEPRSSSLVFMFCAPGPVLGGNDSARSSFHVLRSRTHFRWYGGRRVSF
jgi:hypothetical protein